MTLLKPLVITKLAESSMARLPLPFYVAVRAMQQCARDHAVEFPAGAKAVLNSFYVDDVLTGADTISEAKRLKREMQEILKRGCLELAKWCSNSNSLSNKESPELIEIGDSKVTTVLGLRWLSKEDKFVFHTESKEARPNWTKREILSEIGKLYDPNGFISPVVITAKILMQKIWQEKTDWDEPVPEQITTEWNQFLMDLKCLKLLSIPRWLGMRQSRYAQLHAFSDASEKAYAAVVYLRTQCSFDGSACVRLAQSKFGLHL